jgi:uncharacterized protein
MLTEQCPLDCVYCYIKNRKDDTQLRFEYVEKLSSLFDKNTKPKIIFFGGEPLLKLELINDIVNEFKDKFTFQVVTSGVLNWNKFIDEIYIRNKDIFDLQVSWDGLNNTNRTLRNGFEVGNFVLKSVYDSLEKSIPIQIRSVINEQNVSDLFKIYLTFRNIKKDFPWFTGDMTIVHQVVFPSFFIEKLKSELELVLKNISSDLENFGLNVFIPQFILSKISAIVSGKRGGSCDVGNYIVLRPNGYLYPCTMLSQYDDNFSFGHIDSENFRWEIIEKLKKLSLVQKCKECKFYSICDGGCRYERLLAFGEDWNKKVLETTCLISELWYNTVSDFISNLDKKSFDIINKRILNFISWRSLYELGKYNESKKFRTWGN